MNVYKKLTLLLFCSLSTWSYHKKLLASDSVYVEVGVEENKGPLDYLEGFFDDIDLNALKVWEEKNPPSYLKTVRSLGKEHIKKHKVAYALGGTSLLAVAFANRDHVWKHKEKYLIGSTTAVSVALLYGWWQFNQVMAKRK